MPLSIFSNKNKSYSGVSLDIGSLLSVTVVFAVMVILIASLGRVLVNAKHSYDVYLYEKEGLAQLEDRNQDLARELEYYNSYEYQRLYARDTLHLAEPGERLYRILGEEEYYEVEDLEIDFFIDKNYSRWWLRLL